MMKESGEPGFEPAETSPTAKLETLLPDVEIKELGIEEMPDDIRNFMERRRALFIHPDDPVQDFTDTMKLTHGEGDETFIATTEKNYGPNVYGSEGIDDIEESSYFADLRDGKLVGYAELRWSKTRADDPYFKDKPFIGIIRTDEDHKRQGLGLRRMELMDAVARSRYGCPLYSDTVNSEEMVAVWEKLVAEGRAEKFKEGKNEVDRYFLKNE